MALAVGHHVDELLVDAVAGKDLHMDVDVGQARTGTRDVALLDPAFDQQT